MRFLHPEMARWVLAAPLVFCFWFLYVAAKRRFRRRASIRPQVAALSHLTTWRRDLTVLSASMVAIAALVLAMMQPQIFLEVRMPEFGRQDLILLLDRSVSMRAEDVKPSRASRAIHEIKAFLAQKPEGIDRVALVGFAGTPVVLSQLTRDIDALSLYLDWVEEDVQPQFDTDLGAALASARKLVRKQGAPSKQILLVLSDGEDHGYKLEQVLASLQAERTRVYTIGIGSEAEALIPISRQRGVTTFLEDERGRIVTTRFDETTLKGIAARTGGRYFRSVTGTELAAAMRDVVQAERRQVGWTTVGEYRNLYRFALAAGALCTFILLLTL